MPADNWRPSRGTRRRARARLDPLATGWSPTHVETVVALVEVDRLSGVLARLHREGYGPATRVLDGSREDVGIQLGRLGVNPGTVPAVDAPATNLLVIRAAGRSNAVRTLLATCGINEPMIYPKTAEPVAGDLIGELDLKTEAELSGQDSA